MEGKVVITNYLGAFVIFLIWFVPVYLSGWVFNKEGGYNKAILIVNVVILLALFIGATINSSITLSQSNEQKATGKKLAPAKEIVVRSLIRTYCSSFNAAYWIMDFNSQNNALKNTDKFRGKSIYLERPIMDLLKLQKDIQINNTALGPDLMPSISTFVYSSENLLRELKYYLFIHGDEYAKYDFVTEPPFNELKTMENIANSLRTDYGTLFGDRKTYYPKPKTYLEIKKAWEKAAKETGRLYFDPTIYETKKDKAIFVYGIDNLRAIPGDKLQHGVKAIVYDPNQG
jgi:hypothetical protein